MAHSVVALFCEDVRNENNNSQQTLIGVLPDNIELPRVPVIMPKLGVFIRAVIDNAQVPKRIELKITNTDGSDIPVAQWDQAIIQKGHNDSAPNGMPIFGLISAAVFGPFQIPQTGTVTVTAAIDGVSYVAGALRFVTPATASQQPSALAPSVAVGSSSKP